MPQGSGSGFIDLGNQRRMLYDEKPGGFAAPNQGQNANYVLVQGGNPQAVHQGNLMMLAHQ